MPDSRKPFFTTIPAKSKPSSTGRENPHRPGPTRNSTDLDLQREGWSRNIGRDAEPRMVHDLSRDPERDLLPFRRSPLHARFRITPPPRRCILSYGTTPCESWHHSKCD